MDWAAIASVLADRAVRPIIIVDNSGKIRLYSHELTSILGWMPFEMEGQPFGFACGGTSGATATKRWLTEAFRGTLRTCEWTTLAKAGRKIALRLELSLVGRGSSQSLIVTVVEAQELTSHPPVKGERNLDYDVISQGDDFGALISVTRNGESLPCAQPPETRCFTMFYGLDVPCTDCPVLPTAGDWPRERIRIQPAEKTELGETFEITTAFRTTSNRAHVRMRTVSSAEVTLIHGARIDRIAERAKLSARKREVLVLLVQGQSIDEIATALDIAIRTVKHHQSSLLQKIGADSRADLLRILF